MKFLLLILVGVPSVLFSQGVKVNAYDKFIKKQRLELEPLAIPVQSAKGDALFLSYSAIASTFYLQMSGSGWGASTIDVDNPVIFLFSNDSTVTLKSISLQTFEPGLTQSTYKHQYYITASELEALSRYDLTGIRKYSFKEFVDLSIPRQMVPKIKNFSALFLSELKKANLLKRLKYASLSDVSRSIGDSVQVCGTVNNTQSYPALDQQQTQLQLRSGLTEPQVTLLIPGLDRKAFGAAPDSMYSDKNVCVTGLVEGSKGLPRIVVHTKEQITLKSPIAPADAKFFVGDSLTVVGKIYSSKRFVDNDNLPTLLNMGAAYPDQPLTIVIESNDRKLFTDEPEVAYLNKTVIVTGKIVLYKNKPQIVIHNSDQIKITADTATAQTTVYN